MKRHILSFFMFFIFSTFFYNLSFGSPIFEENSNYTTSLINKETSNTKKNFLFIKLENFLSNLHIIHDTYFYDEKKLDIVDLLKITLNVVQNDQISGILFFIDDNTDLSISDIYNLIEIIKTLKEAKKEIIVYSTNYKKHLFSIPLYADKSFAAEQAIVSVKPPKDINLFFFKDFLTKIGIDIISVNKRDYKVANEVFSRSESSQYLKEMVTNNLQDIKNEWIKLLDERSRNIQLNTENITGFQSSVFFLHDLKKYNLIDDFIPLHNFLDFFQEKYNLFQVHLKQQDTLENLNSNKIVVLKMEGHISPGYHSNPPFIHYKIYLPILKELEDNPFVKAIIIKINSTGGDPRVTNIIGSAIKALSKKKPVITFIEDYGLSGAYFISSSSNLIVANPFSEVGSIGVYSIKFSYKKLSEKLGINHEIFSLIEDPEKVKVATPNEISEMDIKFEDVMLENLYFLFKKAISENRNIDIKKMESIAQGKTYIANKAKSIHLIDEIGSLQTALNIAKEKANLSNVEIINYPIHKLFLTNDLRQPTPQERLSSILQSKEDLEYSKSVENKLIWLLPYQFKWIVYTLLSSLTSNRSEGSLQGSSHGLYLGLP